MADRRKSESESFGNPKFSTLIYISNIHGAIWCSIRVFVILQYQFRRAADLEPLTIVSRSLAYGEQLCS